MTIRPDGRVVPDFEDIGVLASGGGTRGITPAGAAELTRQRYANTSVPTRALGMALGAAETLVPAGQSPAQIIKTNLRSAAKAATDYIKYGVGGVVQPAVEVGRAMGTAALAGDPHAQGAALTTVAATVAGTHAFYGRSGPALPPLHPMALTPPLEASAAAPGIMEAHAARIAAKFGESATPAADATYARMIERRAQRLAPPGYAGPQRRAVDVVNNLADLARKRQAELDAQGFLGTGAESMTPADVLKTQIIGAEDALAKLKRQRAQYAQHTAETILPKIPKE